MKTIAKIICGSVALVWLQGVTAAGMTVSDQGGSVTLQSIGGASQAASAPTVAPDQAQQSARVPVRAGTEKVDRARIEKRIKDRAARTQKRKLEAEKDAADRAAKAKQ